MQFTGTLTADQIQALAAILEERARVQGLRVIHQTSDLIRALEAFKPVHETKTEEAQ